MRPTQVGCLGGPQGLHRRQGAAGDLEEGGDDGLSVRTAGWPGATVRLLHLLDHAPAQVDAAFDTWIFPLLGLIFLPLATLLYAVLWTVGGLSGWAWFWVVLAAVFDIGHSAAGAASKQYQSSPSAAV